MKKCATESVSIVTRTESFIVFDAILTFTHFFQSKEKIWSFDPMLTNIMVSRHFSCFRFYDLIKHKPESEIGTKMYILLMSWLLISSGLKLQAR